MLRLAAFLVAPVLLLAQPLPLSTPEKEGLSRERVNRIHEYFDRVTKSSDRPGAIVMLVRHGRIVDWQAFGMRDVDKKLPMEKDSICAIFSMTKPVTSAAVMMLVEEGKIALSDRADKFIPEFKNLRVYKSGSGAAVETTEPTRPMTIKHLLTHTSGLSYVIGTGPVAEMHRKSDIYDGGSLKEFVTRLSKIPLAANPGDRWEYSTSTDVLGYIVEVASGMPFDEFVQKRILDPLKMPDTYFSVPKSKQGRMARIYTLKDGKLTTQAGRPFDGKVVPYGGMSLYSTIADYSRFAQMLLNGGTLDGKRVLGRKTVELMMLNHLSHLATPTTGGDNATGFGLGGAVMIDPSKAGRPVSPGLFGWNGAASTYFRVDPKEKMAALLFLQWMPFDSATLNLFETMANATIVD